MRIESNQLGGLNSGSNLYVSSGAVVKPTLSYNSGTRELTVGEGVYRTFFTTDFTGSVIQFAVGQTVLTLNDNSKYYVSAKYNNGNPVVYAETNPLIANDSDVIAVYTVFTEGAEIDVLDWDTEAVSLINKLNERLIDTDRYGIVDGFALSASNLIITIGGGTFYLGCNKITYTQIDSTTNDCELIYKNGSGGWISSDVNTYPNTQYDNGTGTLATLTDGHYGVAWVWKSAGNPIEMYIALGNQSYANLDLAKTAKIPSDLPEKVFGGAFLVGRLLFQKGSTSATVESAFDTTFNASTATNHSALLNLQGGVVGEYYHLNQAKYNVVQNTSGTNTGDETQSTILNKIGYTPENVANKAINFTTVNDTLYPTVKAVEDRIDAISHNDTINKQGGTTNEYYHLTAQQYNGLQTTLYNATSTQTISNTDLEVTQIGSGIGNLVIPANRLVVGSRVKCKSKGYISTSNVQTSTVRIKLGATTIIATSSGTLPNNLTNAYVELEFEFVVRSTGVSGTLIGEGRTLISSTTGVGSPTMRQLVMTSPVVINTTVNNTFDLTYQWTNALPTNSLSIEVFALEITG